MNNRKAVLCLFAVFFLFVRVGFGAEEILVKAADQISDPVFSPDGTQIAYVEGTGKNARLQVIDLKSKATRTLAGSPGEKRSPGFSGDGKHLFYCGKAGEGFDIFGIELSTGKSTQLTQTPEDEFAVESSRNRFLADYDKPDSTYFKLFYLKGKEGRGSLFSMDQSGASQTQCLKGEYAELALGGQLTTIALGDESGVSISPYASLSGGDDYRVFLDIPGEPFLATFSKGLTQIAYASGFVHVLARGASGKVVAFDPLSGKSRDLGMNAHSRVAPSPNGKTIAFSDKRDGGHVLVLKDLDDPELRITNYYKIARQEGNPLSGDAGGQLLKQGMIVVPDQIKQFYQLYEENRYGLRESFITADSVYFLFHLFYDFTLKQIEKSRFIGQLAAISRALAAESAKALKQATSEETKKVYKTLWGLFSLASVLENDDAGMAKKAAGKLPKDVQDLVTLDLEKVFEAGEKAESAVLGREVDFSQFKVRGHYESDPRLRAYFRMMMLFGQFSLRVFEKKGGPSPDLPAILGLYYLGSKAKLEKESVLDALEKISSPLSFMVGETEDIALTDLQKLLNGKVPLKSPGDITAPEIVKTAFDTLSPFPKPKIRPFEDVSVMVFPQRFTLDSYAMQKLTYKAVGTDQAPRIMPKMLDVMAVLGSGRAEKILLEILDEKRFKNYEENLNSLKTENGRIAETDWVSNIYRGWLKTFRDVVLLEEKGLEPFTKTDAWKDRILNAVIGSLVTLRHDTILYVKMSAAEAGEGGEECMIEEVPEIYVDPFPKLYGSLKRMALELYARMSAQGYLPAETRSKESEEAYDRVLGSTPKGLCLELIRLLGDLENAALKQEKGIPLADVERKRLLKYGSDLEHLSLALSRPDEFEYNIQNDDVALIADVHTGVGGSVLETAIGRVFNLWVLHDQGQGTRLFRGGVFSFFEFENSGRLSDSEWKKMIVENRLPELPSWTTSFISGKPPKIELSEWERESMQEEAGSENGK